MPRSTPLATALAGDWLMRAAKLAGVLALFVASACGPAQTGPSAAPPAGGSAAPAGSSAAPGGALAEMVEAARREGQLNLVYSQNTTGGAEAVRRWTDGFNRHYGLALNVQFTPGPDMPQMASRLAQQVQAGRTTDTDVFLGTEAHVLQLGQVDGLTPIDWVAWAPNIQDTRLLAPGGVAVEVSSTTPGITYNSTRLTRDEIPTSLEGLLHPRYKGRIASTPYAAIFDRLASPELWGEPRTVGYVTALAENVSGLIRAGEVERIAGGEFDLLAINTNSSDALAWQMRGAPIAHVVPDDAALIQYRYVGVPRTAAHPNAAKLWINYLLGREAQETLYEVGYADHYLLPGSKTASAIEALQAKGVQFTSIDVQWVQRNDEEALGRIREQLQRLLQNR
jgi:ABC-type Fe3+ transport system substrate-binding protein